MQALKKRNLLSIDEVGNSNSRISSKSVRTPIIMGTEGTESTDHIAYTNAVMKHARRQQIIILALSYLTNITILVGFPIEYIIISFEIGTGNNEITYETV